ncbi:hypothetical protein M3231_18550 [Neobacillus mesonae]|nr:hypothetical protein [Neobacillus mesonae]
MTDRAGQYERLIEEVTARIYYNAPELIDRYGEVGRQKCREDNLHHMKHLHTAYMLKNPKVFVDYAVWLNGILLTHGMDTRHLIENFRYISESLHLLEEQEENVLDIYRHCLRTAIDQLQPGY